jgi:hypothetical protein
MERLGRLVKFEVVRGLLDRRWALAGVVWLAVAFLAADDVASHAWNTGIGSWSALDVHATSLNSMLYVGFLLLTAFAVVCADGLVRDRDSGYAQLVLCRAGRRRSWWLAHVGAIVAGALAFNLGFLATCVAVGSARGGQLGCGPSPLAIGMGSGGGDVLAEPLFTPMVPTADMLARELLLVLYLSLAFAAIGCLLAALTVRFPRTWLPVVVALGAVIADWVVNWFVRGDWYLLISPTYRLMEAAHSPLIARVPVSWWSSVAWWASLGITAAAWGLREVERAEI